MPPSTEGRSANCRHATDCSRLAAVTRQRTGSTGLRPHAVIRIDMTDGSFAVPVVRGWSLDLGSRPHADSRLERLTTNFIHKS
jgi:hypothetical protein